MGVTIGLVSMLLIFLAIYLKIGDNNKKLADIIFAVGFIGAAIFVFIFTMASFKV